MHEHSFLHQHALWELLMRLHGDVRECERGWVVSRVFVVLGPSTGVVPDLVYVAPGRRETISERGVEGAPDLLVEALSPRSERLDRGSRMRAYAAAGVPYCWLLDIARRALEVYELGASGYEHVGTHHAGEVYEPALFPGLAIRIAELFE